jgi:hypothetical protein
MPPSGDGDNMHAYVATGVEQGVAALLGSKSTAELLKLVSHQELILMSTALATTASCVAHARTVPVAGRVSSLLQQVFTTIALNTALEAVAVPRDPGITCVNLLGIFFFFGYALHQEGVSLTAQYVLVAHLTTALERFRAKEETLAAAWALAVVPPLLGIGSELVGLAQLVTVETYMDWVRSTLPQNTLLASSILLLYLTAPFAEQFPILRRMYRFAVFAVANDRQMHAIPPWVVAAGMWGLWLADGVCGGGAVGRAFLAAAGANVAVLVVLDAARFALDNDPALTLLSILISIRILEGGAR